MQAIKKLRENSQFFCFQLGQAPLGLEGSGAFRRGRDRDRGRDLGGACRYSRRGLRLRRRGAYGIHRASGPWCQGLCRKVESLRSGGRRLAVRKTIEYQIGALPRTPFPAARDFAPVGSMSLDSRVAWLPYESSSFATSRGNERYEEKNRGVICFMYYSGNPPLVAGATTLPGGKHVTGFAGRGAPL